MDDFGDCPQIFPSGLCGGNFWNGRSEGNEFGDLFPGGTATFHIGDEIFKTSLGSPLPIGPALIDEYGDNIGPTADQALNPMPNPVEQNIERQAVCEHVKASKYAELYEIVWGVEIDCSNDLVDKPADDVDDERAFDISFKRLMLAVCAWQDSKDLNSFSSKRDKALRAELACACDDPSSPVYNNQDCLDFLEIADRPACDDAVKLDENYLNSKGIFPLVWLTDQENYGHDLFYAVRGVGPFPAKPFVAEDTPCGPTGDEPGGLPGKISNCAFCHSDNPVIPVPPNPDDTGDELFQLYSADDYHNIGTPPNPDIPDTGVDPDLGIAGHTVKDGGTTDYPPGFFKTPTLRNVNKRKGEGFIKAYTHNGWFKSMESIVHFYNTADVNGATAEEFGITRCPEGIVTEKDALANNCWPQPAYGGGAIPFLVGDLGLSSCDESAIVAYLKTLTDEHTATAPKPYKPTIADAAPAKKGKKH
jgi:cytochrome c peroxidase